jgi:hypothetical protein
LLPSELRANLLALLSTYLPFHLPLHFKTSSSPPTTTTTTPIIITSTTMSAEWKDKGAAPLSAEFKKAAEDVKKLKATPTNEQKLTVSLYIHIQSTSASSSLPAGRATRFDFNHRRQKEHEVRRSHQREKAPADMQRCMMLSTEGETQKKEEEGAAAAAAKGTRKNYYIRTTYTRNKPRENHTTRRHIVSLPKL